MKTLKIFFPLITTDVLTVDILQVKLREFSDTVFFFFCLFFFFFCLEKVKHASYMRTEIAQEHHGCLIGSSVLLLLLSVNVCVCVWLQHTGACVRLERLQLQSGSRSAGGHSLPGKQRQQPVNTSVSCLPDPLGCTVLIEPRVISLNPDVLLTSALVSPSAGHCVPALSDGGANSSLY